MKKTILTESCHGRNTPFSRATGAIKKFRAWLQKKSPRVTTLAQHEKAPLIELKGRLLESYVKPVVYELHRKTPKGLKYLKEACSK